MDKTQVEEALKMKMLNNTARRRTVFPTTGGVRRNRNHLAEFLGEIGYNKGAEIGVRHGKFSMILCGYNKKLQLSCIDPWSAYNARYGDEKQERIFQGFLRRTSKNKQIRAIRKTSMDALEDFKDGELDFVFIDGNHKFDFVMMDIILWSKKVKSGGIVMCHDFYPFDDCGVWDAVKAYTHAHDLKCYVTKEHEPTAYWVKP